MGGKESAERAANEIKALSARYMADNSWFMFYSRGSGFGGSMKPEDYADAAGRAYAHVQTTKVPLLLGDSKLRTNQELLDNFGVSDAESASPSSSSPAAPRLSIAGAPSSIAAPSPVSPSAAPPAAAPGGILSNSKWSPMLNDAFILGGVNAGKQFVFAPEGDDRAFFRTLAAGASSSPSAPKDAQVNAARPVWREFFERRPRLLWDGDYPRVFAREVLGLALFGYKAAPTAEQLSFDCPDPANPPTHTFDEYLTELHQREFHLKNQRKIITRIAEYLLGSPTALDKIIK